MKACANFNERADPSFYVDSAAVRLQNAGQQLKRCALPRPVAADDSQGLALRDVERYVPQRPEFAALQLRSVTAADQSAHNRGDEVAQRIVAFALAELLGDIMKPDGILQHCKIFSA